MAKDWGGAVVNRLCYYNRIKGDVVNIVDKCIRDIFTRDRLEKLCDTLDTLQASGLDLTKYCYPFIPYVGRGYRQAPKRILYVGRATAGWDDDISIPRKTLLSQAVEETPEADYLSQIAGRYVEGKVILDYSRPERITEKDAEGNAVTDQKGRHFLKMVYQLTLNILDNTPKFCWYDYNESNSQRCFYSVAWSNLLKISMNEDYAKKHRVNPDAKMERFLLAEFDTLGDEIRCLEPHIVIIAIGSFSEIQEKGWDDCLRNTFAQIEFEWAKIGDHIVRISGDGLGKTIVIRTPHPHPGSWGRGWSDEKKYEFIYDCLRKLWR